MKLQYSLHIVLQNMPEFKTNFSNFSRFIMKFYCQPCCQSHMIIKNVSPVRLYKICADYINSVIFSMRSVVSVVKQY